MARRSIIILSPGRSGSSMVAGIFAGHGVWTGNCRPADKWNKRGYFENDFIKRMMLNQYGRDFDGDCPFPDTDWEGLVTAALNREGLIDGPWLFKTGARYYRLFEEFDPVWVKVWRPIDDIMASYDRCGFLPDKKWPREVRRRLIKKQHDIMLSLPGPDIYTPELVKGATFQLECALEECKLTPDLHLINAFIDPKVFHEAN